MQFPSVAGTWALGLYVQKEEKGACNQMPFCVSEHRLLCQVVAWSDVREELRQVCVSQLKTEISKSLAPESRESKEGWERRVTIVWEEGTK